MSIEAKPPGRRLHGRAYYYTPDEEAAIREMASFKGDRNALLAEIPELAAALRLRASIRSARSELHPYVSSRVVLGNQTNPNSP